jgi:hypothetical protein
MTSIPPVSWQGSLFDAGGDPVNADPGPAELSFDRMVRHRLDDRSWIDEDLLVMGGACQQHLDECNKTVRLQH